MFVEQIQEYMLKKIAQKLTIIFKTIDKLNPIL